MKLTYEDVAEAWMLNAPSQYRSMATKEGDLYSYDLLIGRQFRFHNSIQVLLLKEAPTQTTGVHLAAAKREAKQHPHAQIYFVENIEAANERWIDGMFEWVEDSVNRHTKVFAGTGAGIHGIVPLPDMDIEEG